MTERADDCSQRVRVAALVITLNEEAVIEQCLSSILPVTDMIYVLDSESTDRTREIAAANGAIVETRRFDNYSSQRNFALDRIDALFGPSYVLSIDADESLPLASTRAIRDAAERGRADVYLLRCRIVFQGRELRHGLRGSSWRARLFRRGLRYESRGINEHLSIPRGAIVEKVDASIRHDDGADWFELVEKHNRYSSAEASVRMSARREDWRFSQLPQHRHMWNRWIRTNVYERMPFHVAAGFFYQYVFRLGFLDGRAGFYRAFLDLFNEFLIDRKAEELAASDDE